MGSRDNLRSSDTMEALLGLCEGVIEGLENGQQSFYVGDTPLVNSNGTANFTDFSLSIFPGLNEEIKLALGGAARSTTVGVSLGKDLPVVRQTHSGDIDAIDFRILLNALYSLSLSRGADPAKLKLRLEYKPTSAASWITAQTATSPASLVSLLAAPDGELYTDWRTDKELGNESCTFTVSCPVNFVNSAGETRLAALKYKVYTRPVGDTDWFETIPESDWVQAGNSKTLTVSGTRGKRLDVRLYLAQVSRYDDTPAIGPNGSVYHALPDPTGWLYSQVQSGDIQIEGKTTSAYLREFRVPVPRITEPYDLRVTKTSDDNNDNLVSNIQWESFQEIDSQVHSFPDVACAQLRILSTKQLSSLPELYGIYKLMKVRVPTNYDPLTRVYSGVWDGTFKLAWTENPAWHLYDYVMNDRYGMGAYYPVNLDKWETYEAAQWCDEIVADGAPRYTCNMLVGDPRNGKELAVYMAGIFNGVFLDNQDGTAFVKVDKDEPALHLFTPETILDGDFTYTYTDPSVRYNDITVSFTNPDLNWETDRRRVFNQADIDRNGRVTYDYAAVGCIYEKEAIRRATYKLVTALTETMLVSFKTNRRGQSVRPFDIILIGDSTLGYSLTGRLRAVAADGMSATLRDPIYLEVGVTYQIELDTGTELITRTLLVGEAGSQSTLYFNAALPTNLPEKCSFSLSQNGAGYGAPKPFRVVSVEEASDNPGEIYEITAAEINRNKWAIADSAGVSVGAEYSALPSPGLVPEPTAVVFQNRFVPQGKIFQLVVNSTFNKAIYPWYNGEVEVWSRKTGSGEPFVQQVMVGTDSVNNHPSGDYDFKILAKSWLGTKTALSAATIRQFKVVNIADPPADVTGVTVVREVTGAQVSWQPVPDPDWLGYEIREVQNINGWDEGTIVVEDFIGTSFFIQIKDGATHTYLLRAVDVLGNYSTNSAAITASVIPPGDVTRFLVTPQGDACRFDWDPVAGVNIDFMYSIRVGDSYNTGTEIVRTKSTTKTLLVPGGGSKTFWIKAISPQGLASINALLAQADLTGNQSRNLVYHYDNAGDSWAGVSNNLSAPIAFPDALALTLPAQYGEHFFDVTLPKSYTARAWLDTQMLDIGEMLMVTDIADLPISDPILLTPWSPVGDVDGATLRKVIMTEGTYSGLLGFSFKSTLLDMASAISPTSSSGVSYEDARVSAGLYLGDFTSVSYTAGVSVPAQFGLSYKLKVGPGTSGEALLLRLESTTGWIWLQLSGGNLMLVASDGGDISVPVNFASGTDFLTIGVTQNATTRGLYYTSEYGKVEQFNETAATPIGDLTAYHIN